MKIIIAILVTLFIAQLTPVQAQINNQTQVETQRVAVAEVAPKKEEPEPTPVIEAVHVQEAPVLPINKIELLRAVNIPEDQWYAVDYILSKESTDWCPTRWQGYLKECPSAYYLEYEGAEEDKSKGYGICQSTPAIKMESAGSDWRTNALTQLRWCNDYAIARYGSWHGAYQAWISKNWW